MDKEYVGAAIVIVVFIIGIFQIASWTLNTTLSPLWECTKWHVVGEKDNQFGVCDQYTRKVK